MPTKAKSNGHDSDEHTTIPLAVIEASKEITGAWNQQVASIIETGRVLKRHKDTLPRGYFGMVFDDANPEKPPFSDRTAQRLMKICEHRVLADPTHVSHLPPHWGTLYELSKIPDPQLEELIEDGEIHAEMEREEAHRLQRDIEDLGDDYGLEKLLDTLRETGTLMKRCEDPEKRSRLLRPVCTHTIQSPGFLDMLGKVSSFIEGIHADAARWSKQANNRKSPKRSKVDSSRADEAHSDRNVA